MRQNQNVAASRSNPNENWMAKKLAETSYKWRRQAQWGYRLYDFWCHQLGIAIEIDGPEHDQKYDAYRDEYNFRWSGIVVLRVQNCNEEEAAKVIAMLDVLGSWKDRRHELGLDVHTRKGRRHLLELSRFPSLLERYLSDVVLIDK